MGEFTHFNQHGDAIMVDISKKAETAREAIAEGRISMNQECFDQLKAGSIGKGDVLGVARIAGIMGAKKTSELIPLCHLLSLTKAEILSWKMRLVLSVPSVQCERLGRLVWRWKL